MKKAVFLDVNGLKIEATDLDQDLVTSIANTFDRFIIDEPITSPDILISEMTDLEKERISVGDAKNLTRYWLHDSPNGTPFIVSSYRGELDMLIYPDAPIRLKFVPRKRLTGKLTGCIYLCLLITLLRRKEMLFQGALISKDDMPIMLCGVSGAGKTTLLLHLLKKGWGYLSDNTCLLKSGTVYPFRSKIAFNYHHFEHYPEVFSESNIDPDSFKKAGRVNLMRDLTRKYLPGYLLEAPPIKKMTNPFMHRHPKELFPKTHVLNSANCRFITLLSPGNQLSVTKIETGDAIDRLALLHRFAWPQYTELSDLFQFVTGQPLLIFSDALRENLSDAVYYQMTVPNTKAFDDVLNYFEEKIPPLMQSTYKAVS